MVPKFTLRSFGAAVMLSLITSTPSGAALEAGFIPTLDKLRRDQTPPQVGRQVALHAARAEGESAQIIIHGGGEALKDVRVTAQPLVSQDGEKLKLETALVGYLSIEQPTPDGYGVTGDYPDILGANKPFDLPAGQSQAVWITAWVPATAKPGVYRGSVTVEATGEGEGKAAKTLEVEMTVHHTVLPRQGILKTNFGYSPWVPRKAAYYGPQWDGSETEAAFLRKMLDYRLGYACTGLNLYPSLAETFYRDDEGNWQARWEAFDREVSHHLEAGVNYFQLSLIPLSYHIKEGETLVPAPRPNLPTYSREDQAAILKLMNRHFIEKGWQDRFAWRLFDEPLMSKENVHIIQELADFIHEHSPVTPLMMVTTDTRERQLADERPRYLWVPHLPSLALSEGYEEFLKERQQIGEPAWSYICVTRIIGQHQGEYVGHPFADVGGIDRTGASQRILGIQAWRNRLDGFLYWDVADWDYYTGYNSPTNPYKGEGVLFYPDIENKGVPFASMRAAALRDGFEDHDLLWLLNQKVEALEKAGNLPASAAPIIATARELLDVTDLAPNLQDFHRDTGAYERKHAEILRTLDALEPY